MQSNRKSNNSVKTIPIQFNINLEVEGAKNKSQSGGKKNQGNETAKNVKRGKQNFSAPVSKKEEQRKIFKSNVQEAAGPYVPEPIPETRRSRRNKRQRNKNRKDKSAKSSTSSSSPQPVQELQLPVQQPIDAEALQPEPAQERVQQQVPEESAGFRPDQHLIQTAVELPVVPLGEPAQQPSSDVPVVQFEKSIDVAAAIPSTTELAQQDAPAVPLEELVRPPSEEPMGSQPDLPQIKTAVDFSPAAPLEEPAQQPSEDPIPKSDEPLQQPMEPLAVSQPVLQPVEMPSNPLVELRHPLAEDPAVPPSVPELTAEPSPSEVATVSQLDLSQVNRPVEVPSVTPEQQSDDSAVSQTVLPPVEMPSDPLVELSKPLADNPVIPPSVLELVEPSSSEVSTVSQLDLSQVNRPVEVPSVTPEQQSEDLAVSQSVLPPMDVELVAASLQLPSVSPSDDDVKQLQPSIVESSSIQDAQPPIDSSSDKPVVEQLPEVVSILSPSEIIPGQLIPLDVPPTVKLSEQVVETLLAAPEGGRIAPTHSVDATHHVSPPIQAEWPTEVAAKQAEVSRERPSAMSQVQDPSPCQREQPRVELLVEAEALPAPSGVTSEHSNTEQAQSVQQPLPLEASAILHQAEGLQGQPSPSAAETDPSIVQQMDQPSIIDPHLVQPLAQVVLEETLDDLPVVDPPVQPLAQVVLEESPVAAVPEMDGAAVQEQIQVQPVMESSVLAQSEEAPPTPPVDLPIAQPTGEDPAQLIVEVPALAQAEVLPEQPPTSMETEPVQQQLAVEVPPVPEPQPIEEIQEVKAEAQLEINSSPLTQPDPIHQDVKDQVEQLRSSQPQPIELTQPLKEIPAAPEIIVEDQVSSMGSSPDQSDEESPLGSFSNPSEQSSTKSSRRNRKKNRRRSRKSKAQDSQKTIDESSSDDEPESHENPQGNPQQIRININITLRIEGVNAPRPGEKPKKNQKERKEPAQQRRNKKKPSNWSRSSRRGGWSD